MKKSLIAALQKIVARSAVRPAVYVGTYAKYNNGDLTGKWLYLDDYEDEADFLKAAVALHKDEKDPELMFQDYQGFPESYYGESGLADGLWDWLKMDEEDKNMLEAYTELVGGHYASLEGAKKAFMSTCESPEDWAQEFLDETGGLSEEQASYYLTISEADKKMIASDEANSRIQDMSDDEVLTAAETLSPEIKEEYEELDAKLDEESETLSKDDLKKIEKRKEKLVEMARDAFEEEETGRIMHELDDPEEYFVHTLGQYTLKELMEQPFIQIDYEAYARDAELSGDVSFVKSGGTTWVFSNH